MSDGLLLHGGVHDDALELGGLDGLECEGGLDGGLEQLLDTGLTEQAPESSELGRVARGAGARSSRAR